MSPAAWLVSDAGLRALALLFAKATVVLLVAVAVAAALARASAALRHALWTRALLGLLALPALALLLPRWEAALLPPTAEDLRVAMANRTASRPALRLETGPAVAQSDDWPRPQVAAGDRAVEAPAVAWAGPTARPPAFAKPGPPLVAVSLWLAGVALGIVRLLAGTAWTWRATRNAKPVVDTEWRRLVDGCRARLGLGRDVSLGTSEAVALPVVWGYRRFALLLPLDADSWPEDRKRAFLLHELAHVARHDCLIQWLVSVAQALYWPHPLVWWAARRLRREAERACDDRVLAAGTAPQDLARHLLEAVERLDGARALSAATAVVESSAIEGRLRALLDPRLSRRMPTRAALLAAAACALVLVASIAGLEPVARAGVARGLPRVLVAAARPTTRAVAPAPRPQALAVPTGEAVRAAATVDRQDAAPGPDGIAADSPASAPEPVVAPIVVVAEPIAPPAQESSSPPASAPLVVRIGVDLVQVDAVVTDDKGHPVTGLGPADFEVFEDGRRRSVSHLTYVAAAPPPAKGGADAAADNADTLLQPRDFVFVVDDLELSFEGMVHVRNLLAKFAESQAGSDDRGVVLQTAGPDGQHELTSDWSRFGVTAQALRYTTRSGIGLTPLEPFDSRGYRVEVSAYRSFRARESIDALASALNLLRALPGRKALILLSEGFPIATADRDFHGSPFRAFGDDWGIDHLVRKLGDLANRASVVIHTIDPRGLVYAGPTAADGVLFSPSDPNARPTPGWPSTSDRRSSLLASQQSLMYLSEQTGGLSVTNTNDLFGGLRGIADAMSGYYLIGYEPDRSTFRGKPGRPSFHSLVVKLKRKGLNVRSRKGFYGVTDEEYASTAPVPVP